MNQFGLERKAELIEYINEDFSKIKDYDFNDTLNDTLSCSFVDLCILLTIKSLDDKDSGLYIINKYQEFYLLNLLLKLKTESSKEYILKSIVSYIFSENEADRLRKKLEN